MASPIARADLTGVVLAGGRGSRMGGVDKGRQSFRGEALAARAARRLAPQVAHLLISANRHLDDYRLLAPVVTDTVADFPGPLGGIAAALHATTTPFLVCVPCDTPFFPSDLVARLAAAFADSRVELATACAPDIDDAVHAGSGAGGALRSHPVFALMRTSIAPRLDASLRAGERRLNAWRMHHKSVEVVFPDGHAFYNVNTLQALDDAG